jgi:hypothetical protein
VVSRGDVELLADTTIVTQPVPDPLSGDTVIHAAPDDAVHVQLSCVVTVSAALPFPAPTDTDAGETA